MAKKKSIIQKIRDRSSATGFSEAQVVVGAIRKKLGLIPVRPLFIFMEITNGCNLKCVMCDRQTMTRATGVMHLDECRMVIDNAKRFGVPNVKLNRFGEPLINREIVEIVKYAKSKGIGNVFFTTNATLLNENLSRQLIEAGLDEIQCSVDGLDKETYEEIRLGGDFAQVTNNIRRFCEIKKELGSKKPHVLINTILMDKTQDQMREIVRYWSGIADEVDVRPVAKYGNIEDLSVVDRTVDALRPCHHPFDRLMVLWNLDVTVCGGDIDGKLVIGNLRENSLEELWRGEKITDLRKRLLKKNFSELPKICQDCDGIRADVHRQRMQLRDEANKFAE